MFTDNRNKQIKLLPLSLIIRLLNNNNSKKELFKQIYIQFSIIIVTKENKLDSIFGNLILSEQQLDIPKIKKNNNENNKQNSNKKYILISFIN